MRSYLSLSDTVAFESRLLVIWETYFALIILAIKNWVIIGFLMRKIESIEQQYNQYKVKIGFMLTQSHVSDNRSIRLSNDFSLSSLYTDDSPQMPIKKCINGSFGAAHKKQTP